METLQTVLSKYSTLTQDTKNGICIRPIIIMRYNTYTFILIHEISNHTVTRRSPTMSLHVLPERKFQAGRDCARTLLKRIAH